MKLSHSLITGTFIAHRLVIVRLFNKSVSLILSMARQLPSVKVETLSMILMYRYVCVFRLYSLLLFFCVSVSSSELEPEPTDELSRLSCGQVRKPSPNSDREGVNVRERIRSRLFGLMNFLIFNVIQFPRLQNERQSKEWERRQTRTRGGKTKK